MHETINYYNTNAEQFVAETRDVDFSKVRNKFLAYLFDNAKLLDFGCGSGRDTKAFLQMGYDVDALDGSVKMCKCTEEYTGIQVRNIFFQEFDERNKYDGIWACASLLHVSLEQMSDVFCRIAKALKKNGIVYMSFKYGDFCGIRKGRKFTDMNEYMLDGILTEVNALILVEKWITSDVRTGRKDEKWMNVILKRKM